MTVDTDVTIDEKIEKQIIEPKKFKVIFVNDDQTPMDFVIHLLQKIYHHSEDTARDITMEIHNNGAAVVGVYSFEVAEQKTVESTTESRSMGFPLQIRVESE